MDDVFDVPGDAMKPGIFWGSRDKLIHSVGTTGKVKFVPNSNADNFSGMFKKADHGLIRLSSAKKPDTSSIAPGFGLKFLRNGMDSANLVAMYSVDGTDDFNFFAKDFTTFIPAAKSDALKLLEKKFSTATDHIAFVGL